MILNSDFIFLLLNRREKTLKQSFIIRHSISDLEAPRASHHRLHYKFNNSSQKNHGVSHYLFED